MRPARRSIRAASSGIVVAALVTALLPALPALAGKPVKVTGHEISTSVERQRVVPLPTDTSHVVLRWSGDHEARISVAFGTLPNEVGEEVPVEHSEDADHQEGEDGTEEFYGSVLWTGGARFARITTDRPLGKVTVVAIDAGADVGYASGGIAVANGAMSQPTIIPRSGWHADESLRFDSGGNEVWPPSFSPMQKAIVHHTAGRNNDPNPAATVRAIYYMYAISRDYGDIGYNFLIDEAGRIYEGRYSREYGSGEMPTGEDLAGNVVRGAHARNYNDANVGIVLLGTFMNRQPTAAARTSLERLLAWKLERHGIDPLGASTYVNPVLGHTKWLPNIAGHRQVNATACPGDTFFPTFGQLRQNVANRINGTTGPANDSTPPGVDSLVAMATTPTGAPTIPFGLTFDEPIEGLEPSDFEVNGSSQGWSVSGITGAGSTWTVHVAGDSNPNDGSVELTLAAEAVTDLAGLTGPAEAVIATAEWAEDQGAPTVELYQTPHKKYINDTKLDYVDFTATFSEPVADFDPSDVSLGGTAHAADPWLVRIIFGSGADYGFSVENGGGWVNGTLLVQIQDGAVADLAGNPVQASNLVAMVFDRSAPTTSAPRASLRAGTTLSGGSVRAAISWSGNDVGPAGIAAYDVARSIDGGPFKMMASGVEGTSLGKVLKPGHTYRYEVRARDKAGNVGGWRAGPTIRPRLVQQTNDGVRFSGDTGVSVSTSYSGGSVRYLAEGGAFAKLRTEARSLSFVTTRGPNRGAARIYVDGVLEATVDLYADSPTYRYVAFAKTWSSVGTHTIRVVAVGTPGRQRVDVDAFGVIR